MIGDSLPAPGLAAHLQLDESATADRDAIRESPLVVGVLGHRELDPAHLPRFGDALTAFVAEIRARLPDTELHAIIGVTRGGDLYT